MSEPIEHRNELYKAEKGDGQLLLASGDPTMPFDAGKVVFDRVSVRIEVAIEAIGSAPRALGRDADHGSALCEAKPKFIRIEGLVGDRPATV
jgi:hypothetical protein